MAFLQKDSYYDRTVKLHSWIDNIHNEENRLDTIKEIVPKNEQDNFTNPLKLYHSNWKDIDKCAHTFATRVGMYFAKIIMHEGIFIYCKIFRLSIRQAEKSSTLPTRAERI